MNIINLFGDYTLAIVAIGSGLFGMISGALGTFAMIRKQSLLGDAISHATLPGIALVFIIFNTKNSLYLALGAILIGWLSTKIINLIVNNSRIKYDTILAIILSVFFGIGMVLMTYIQKQPNSNQAGLDKFLFGQAAALMVKDIINMSILGIIALIIVFILWKEFKIISFDPQYAKTIGFPVKFLDGVITFLIVISIVIGLQTVGVILMSAMLIAPAAAARQWTNKLGLMIIISGFFGAISGISGALISSTIKGLSTGPTIVIIMTGIAIFSFIFAIKRGLFFKWLRNVKNRKNIHSEFLLESMYEIISHHENKKHKHNIDLLYTFFESKKELMVNLENLKNKDYIEFNNKTWNLTEKGINKIESVVN